MRRYKHLSYEERTLICHYASKGYGISWISQLLNRSKSTISTELKRNKNQTGYNPQSAHNRYYARRARACLLDHDINLQAYILDRLYERHTPEQISGRLKTYGDAEKGIRYINHESIYQWLYRRSKSCTFFFLVIMEEEGEVSVFIEGRSKRESLFTIVPIMFWIGKKQGILRQISSPLSVTSSMLLSSMRERHATAL